MIERDGPMPWSRAAPLLAQICGALQEAHELGIVHRDLKPENVLITRTAGGRDYAKVLDFGLAKLDQRKPPSTMTDKQQIVGTPYFMSPEQIRGDDVDARSDIYSFGALMFEVLTGQHLFTGSTAVGVLTKHLTAEPDAPSMRAPKMGIDPQRRSPVPQGAREGSARALADRGRARAGDRGGLRRDGRARDGPGPQLVARACARATLHVAAEDHDESDLRLRRSDIDAFERGLKRRRVFVLARVVALLVLGGAAPAAWFVMREPPPLTEEAEPNNDAAHANADRGRRRSPASSASASSAQDGDRDIFVVPCPAGSRRVVTVRVTGLPNIDINLAVTDGDGVHARDVRRRPHRRGRGRSTAARSTARSSITVGADACAKGSSSRSRTSATPYTLTVTEEHARRRDRAERHGRRRESARARRNELRGYLDHARRRRCAALEGADGTYNVIVRAEASRSRGASATAKRAHLARRKLTARSAAS